jgi:hypothetical protein
VRSALLKRALPLALVVAVSKNWKVAAQRQKQLNAINIQPLSELGLLKELLKSADLLE